MPRLVAATALAFAAALVTAITLIAGMWPSAGEAQLATAAATATPAPAASATPSQPARAAATTRITVRKSRYGRVIFDGRGRALYLFTLETSRTPRCYGACADAWPPFLARGRVRAGRGARQSLIGTTRRRDGRRQVTYRGRPLYHYVGDREPGQILGQNVFEFGGLWLVVRPDGRAVR